MSCQVDTQNSHKASASSDSSGQAQYLWPVLPLIETTTQLWQSLPSFPSSSSFLYYPPPLVLIVPETGEVSSASADSILPWGAVSCQFILSKQRSETQRGTNSLEKKKGLVEVKHHCFFGKNKNKNKKPQKTHGWYLGPCPPHPENRFCYSCSKYKT